MNAGDKHSAKPRASAIPGAIRRVNTGPRWQRRTLIGAAFLVLTGALLLQLPSLPSLFAPAPPERRLSAPGSGSPPQALTASGRRGPGGPQAAVESQAAVRPQGTQHSANDTLENRATKAFGSRAVPQQGAEAGPGAAPKEPPTIEFLDAPPGQKAGLQVFPPPGTKPVKTGIIVPEDFELPEGYLRHYQTTDDGETLPPILMFHPDFEWADEQGVRRPLPSSRIVPPEMAPPGMPIRILEPPQQKGSGRAAPP